MPPSEERVQRVELLRSAQTLQDQIISNNPKNVGPLNLQLVHFQSALNIGQKTLLDAFQLKHNKKLQA